MYICVYCLKISHISLLTVHQCIKLYIMWPSLGKSTISTHQLKSTFYLYVKVTFMHYQETLLKYLTIDGQVCFYRQPFANAVEPRGCISWPWGALIGMHGIPSCSWWQSCPPLWIVSVYVKYWGQSTALWVQMVALPRLWLLTRPPSIDSICDITGAEKNYLNNRQHSSG